MLRTSLPVIVSAVVLASAAAPPAQAVAGVNVSARIEGGRLVIDGRSNPGGETVYISLESNSTWRVSAAQDVFTTVMVDPGAGCTQIFTYQVSCPASGLTRMDVNLYEGPDMTVVNMGTYLNLAALRLPMLINGGGGRDDLRGGPLDDEIHGDAGNDRLIGDEGKDRLYGGTGDDELTGDTVTTPRIDQIAADEIHGEMGIDTLVEQRIMNRVQYWLIDGIAHSGADMDDDLTNGSEEGDTIFPDVENLTLGADDDRIVGSNVANRIDAYIGDDTVYALGGNDTINVYFTGTNYVDAGTGDDTISGKGTLIGGEGDDTIEGSGANDTIVPGRGADDVRAFGGNDVINAADGAIDVIDCDTGTDVIAADAGDILGTSPWQLCEYVMGPVTAPKLTTAKATMRVVAPGRGRMTTTILAGRTVLGSSTTATRGAGSVAISVPWNRAGKSKSAARQVATTVRLTFYSGTSRRPWSTTSRAVTFRR